MNVFSSAVFAVDRMNAHTDFLGRVPRPGLKFEHNDYVRVTAGVHVGQCGSLVGLHTDGEDPSFVLEAETGHDLVVHQSEIELIDGNPEGSVDLRAKPSAM
jgi:hypothetical protein